MRKFLGFWLLTIIFVSCIDDEHYSPAASEEKDLVTPELSARMASSSIAFTGLLEVYPCLQNTSTYYGNYRSGRQVVINGTYIISDGEVKPEMGLPVILPIGTYNILYWGKVQSSEPTYNNVAASDAPLSIGSNLSQQYIGLWKPSLDTLYYPIYDYVYAVNPVEIGNERLSASLQRKVAGVKIILTNKDGKPFDDDIIKDVTVHIGGISEKMNFYTAEPVNPTKTVGINLSLSSDKMQYSNATAMLLPSSDSPLLQIFITLKNGAVKIFKQNLSKAFIANEKLTLSLSINEIFSEESSSGGFDVDQWDENHETIDLPPIN